MYIPLLRGLLTNKAVVASLKADCVGTYLQNAIQDNLLLQAHLRENYEIPTTYLLISTSITYRSFRLHLIFRVINRMGVNEKGKTCYAYSET